MLYVACHFSDHLGRLSFLPPAQCNDVCEGHFGQVRKYSILVQFPHLIFVGQLFLRLVPGGDEVDCRAQSEKVLFDHGPTQAWQPVSRSRDDCGLRAIQGRSGKFTDLEAKINIEQKIVRPDITLNDVVRV